jgi:hypothetical protein
MSDQIKLNSNVRAEGGEVALPLNAKKTLPDKSLSFVFYEELVEFDFQKNVSPSANLNWVKAWLANHKVGSRLPRGKAFNSHRHLESKAGSQAVGKLILGSIKTALNFG